MGYSYTVRMRSTTSPDCLNFTRYFREIHRFFLPKKNQVFNFYWIFYLVNDRQVITTALDNLHFLFVYIFRVTVVKYTRCEAATHTAYIAASCGLWLPMCSPVNISWVSIWDQLNEGSVMTYFE